MKKQKLVSKLFTELLILTMIDHLPQPGIHILEHLDKLNFPIAKGTFYPLMSSCIARSLIVIRSEEMDNGRGQRCYMLTEIGRNQLKSLRKQWQAANRILNSATHPTLTSISTPLTSATQRTSSATSLTSAR